MRIPIGEYEGRTSHMLNPVIEGRMLQSLAIDEDDTVLQIGTGTGYITACLATLARHVDSVDINPEMIAMAETNLAHFEITNVTLGTGDGSDRWEQKPFYDCIAIMGSLPEVPEFYKKALKDDGGRMFVVVISGYWWIEEDIEVQAVTTSGSTYTDMGDLASGFLY